MEKLGYYAEMVQSGKICYKGTKNPVIANDCNLKGLSLELAVKDYYNLPLEISNAHGIDIIFQLNGKRTFAEVKSNGSPIAIACSRSSYMMYVFGVDLNKPLNGQWGYVVNKSSFMTIGKKLGHIKQGTTAGGRVDCVKTQTVWNNSKNAPHGTKAYKLEDAYIAAGANSFEEWFR